MRQAYRLLERPGTSLRSEEFAIFACLRQRGTQVMVYPGSFSTLAEIAEGQHPDAPRGLRDLVVVSLHLRGR